MGRNQNHKKAKKIQPSEQENSQEESKSGDEADANEPEPKKYQDYDEEFEEEDFDGDEAILNKISNKIKKADDEEKISWAAIYELKKQEAQLNDLMQQEIDAIKQKYDAQRMPLMQKISEVVSGKKLQKSIYAKNNLIKQVNLNKTKPKKLKDYWSKVLDACGLIGNQDDIELLDRLILFKIDLIDPKIQKMKLTFEFENNDYFNNKIVIQVEGNPASDNFKKNIECSSKKKLFDQNSLFGLLTQNQTDDQEFYETCFDLYRSYINSTYFYFHEAAQGQLYDDGKQDDQDDQEENEEEEDVKPVAPKGSSIKEKPECNQQ